MTVEKYVIETVPGEEINEGDTEIYDDVLKDKLDENRALIREMNAENRKLKREFDRTKYDLGRGRGGIEENNREMRKLAELKADRSELESRLKITEKDIDRL